MDQSIFDIISPSEYTQRYQEPPIEYDLSHFNGLHEILDGLMRKYWEFFHPLERDIMYSFSKEYNNLLDRINSVSQEIDQYKLKVKNLKKQLSEYESGTDELQSGHMELKQEINQILDLNERLKWKIKASELEQKEINDKLTKSLKENFELRKQLESKSLNETYNIEDEEFDRNELIKENRMLNDQLVSIFEEKETLERINSDLKSELHDLKFGDTKETLVKIDVNNESYDSDSNSIVNHLETENKHLNEKIIEVLQVNRKTATLINVLIEMRKQMLVLQHEVKSRD
jgi:chromosome segregation ATPase